MGAKNAIAAMTVYQHIGHAPMRLLMGMALHSLDEPSAEHPAGRAFLGEERLTQFVNCGPSSMYDHLKKLHQAGAVTTVVRGGPGRRAVYQLHLNPVAEAMPPAHPEAYVSGSPGGSASGPPGGSGSGSPGGLGTTEDPLEEIKSKENSSPLSTSGDEGYGAASAKVIARLGPAVHERLERVKAEMGLDDRAATIELARRLAA